jgi:hypothetical protein
MPRKVSLKTLRRKAWDACSRYIRRCYSDHRGWTVCYTCGASGDWRTMDAGHAIPGRTNAVLYDTDIIRCQCKICNIYKRGQHHIFTAKLIRENGLEWWERKLQGSRRLVKYNREDYERIREEFEWKTQQLSVDCRAQKWGKAK